MRFYIYMFLSVTTICFRSQVRTGRCRTGKTRQVLMRLVREADNGDKKVKNGILTDKVSIS